MRKSLMKSKGASGLLACSAFVFALLLPSAAALAVAKRCNVMLDRDKELTAIKHVKEEAAKKALAENQGEKDPAKLAKIRDDAIEKAETDFRVNYSELDGKKPPDGHRVKNERDAKQDMSRCGEGYGTAPGERKQLTYLREKVAVEHVACYCNKEVAGRDAPKVPNEEAVKEKAAKLEAEAEEEGKKTAAAAASPITEQELNHSTLGTAHREMKAAESEVASAKRRLSDAVNSGADQTTLRSLERNRDTAVERYKRARTVFERLDERERLGVQAI